MQLSKCGANSLVTISCHRWPELLLAERLSRKPRGHAAIHSRLFRATHKPQWRDDHGSKIYSLDLMTPHPIQLEISGPTALWTRPDTGSSPVSYVAPMFSAVKGILAGSAGRRAALKLVEGWRSANEHTARGDIIHEHPDLPGYEVAKGVLLWRALPVFSDRLGLSGKCDIVEVIPNAEGRIQSAHSGGI